MGWSHGIIQDQTKVHQGESRELTKAEFISASSSILVHLQQSPSSEVTLHILIMHGRISWHEYLIMQGKYKQIEILGDDNFQMTWVQTRICDLRWECSTSRSCPSKPFIPWHETWETPQPSWKWQQLLHRMLKKRDKHMETESMPAWGFLSLQAVSNTKGFFGTLMVSSTPDHYGQNQTGFPLPSSSWIDLNYWAKPPQPACNLLAMKDPASETQPRSAEDELSWL